MRRRPAWLFTAAALAVAVVLATAASPFASSSPDGLERVGEDEGFAAGGRLHAVQEDSPAPGYAFPGVSDERLATALAGLTGTLAVVTIGGALALLPRRRRRASGGRGGSGAAGPPRGGAGAAGRSATGGAGGSAASA